MQQILKGLKQFQREVFPHHRKLYEALSTAQEPRALLITCGDSRVVPTLFTQTKPGDLFICRHVGNIVPPYGGPYGGVSATVEYAVDALHVKHIIVVGHTDCGAMRAVLHPEKMAGLPNVAGWLGYVSAARDIVEALYPDAPEEEKLHQLTERNVLLQLKHLETHPPVAVALARGRLSLHGWMYHLDTGDVDSYDPDTRQFVRITFSDEDAATGTTPAEAGANA
ncbi:MAG: carbonic anhydrase [Bryobacterales bacterium]|jgi:carbonic anhydrase|nr:carbonic anhydrase [Bryobacterales bacterium]